MKFITSISLVMILFLGSFLCNAQTGKKSVAKSNASLKVEVYYFHFTQRCSTCHAVEDNAKSALEALYSDKVKKGDYVFKGINLDDSSSKAIAKKLGIGGQSLLVVCGNKKVDITSQGFMYAHEPNKIKEEVKKAIEKVLKG
ncbi:MAG: nitrophenyl compound nitroreductase subunit ArsF family protein [Bacteroidota bacterium]|nr:nitrophenyl compound nitroreductase subunit ArsF family protein [Bacteroidota bacterium]MDP4204818.1 nitrophenyl compound nitroreductase subunit ArsF family protein [Bacteroidota bacterium]